MTDLDRLEDLARKSTPGPWRAIVEKPWSPDQTPSRIDSADGVCIQSSLHPTHARNAPFIAAANPATVLSLIAELRAARAVVETARGVLHAYSDPAPAGMPHRERIDGMNRPPWDETSRRWESLDELMVAYDALVAGQGEKRT